MLNRPKPVVLLILDGFGYTLDEECNAIAMANTPCWDQLQKDCLMTLLRYSSLSDLAPIVLAMLGVEQPMEMTGRSLNQNCLICG